MIVSWHVSFPFVPHKWHWFSTRAVQQTHKQTRLFSSPGKKVSWNFMQNVLFPNPGHTETPDLAAQNWHLPSSALHSNRHLCCQGPRSLWYSSNSVMLARQEPKVTSPEERPGLKALPHCVAIWGHWCPPAPLHTMAHAPGSTRGFLGNLSWSAGLKAENWLEDELWDV